MMILLAVTLPPEDTVSTPVPLLPIVSVDPLLQSELLPVTKTVLLEAEEFMPMLPLTSSTVPPLLIVSLLLEPESPTVNAAVLLQNELLPVTMT